MSPPKYRLARPLGGSPAVRTPALHKLLFQHRKYRFRRSSPAAVPPVIGKSLILLPRRGSPRFRPRTPHTPHTPHSALWGARYGAALGLEVLK